jgi:hypothetical protein
VIALLRFLFGGAESSPCGAPCVLPYCAVTVVERVLVSSMALLLGCATSSAPPAGPEPAPLAESVPTTEPPSKAELAPSADTTASAELSPTAVSPPQAEAAPNTDGDVCKIVRCRPKIRFALNDNSGRRFLTTVPPTPYAADGIAVYPGDDFFVAADEEDGRLHNFRYIDPPTNPKDVIHVVSFVQQQVNGRYSMVLTLQSFYARPLLYHALAHDAPSPQFQYRKTSTCPIVANGRAIELWPEAITFMKLQDFSFARGGEPCAYY